MTNINNKSMEISTYHINTIPSDWNDYILKNKIGIIHNTIEYAKYSVNEGFKPKFVRIVDSTGSIVLQNILYEYEHQLTKIPKIIQKISKKFDIRYKWHYGPTSNSHEAIEYFFNFLKKENKKYHGMSHPLSKFENLNIKKLEWATFLIDLKKPKEEILQNMDKKSVRKNIERSIERGVTIEKIDTNNLYEYLEIFNQNKSDSKREKSTENQIKEFWRILTPIGFSGFLARKDGICLGGMLFSFFNKYMNEWGVARSNLDYEQKLYSQDLIKSKIIEWGIENKMNWYDLSGINPNPVNSKERGILQYKKKWGGEKFEQLIFKN